MPATAPLTSSRTCGRGATLCPSMAAECAVSRDPCTFTCFSCDHIPLNYFCMFFSSLVFSVLSSLSSCSFKPWRSDSDPDNVLFCRCSTRAPTFTARHLHETRNAAFHQSSHSRLGILPLCEHVGGGRIVWQHQQSGCAEHSERGRSAPQRLCDFQTIVQRDCGEGHGLSTFNAIYFGCGCISSAQTYD